jgi:membrane protease YdiL (CAAX protease family)
MEWMCFAAVSGWFFERCPAKHESFMPIDSVQLSLATFEITLQLAGTGLFLWLVSNSRQRQRWLHTSALPYWGITLPEFLLFVLLAMAGGFMGQTLVHSGLGAQISASPDKAGLEVFAYGAGFHGGILLGYLLFPLMRVRFYSDYGARPDISPRSGSGASWSETLRHACGALLIALPLLTLISLGWTELLRAGGLPDEPQDLIARFAESKSGWVIGGMLFVACVLAPVSEELLFRAGLYRFVRQKLGRTPALLISSLCFGALHGNWAGSLPLAVLGMLLAIVYEATGSIRVVIIAHGLFNLNTILIVLSGLPEVGP